MSRETPKALSSQYYHLINQTNRNRMRFDVLSPERTKNRNQIYVFRAAVVNTYYNRFTYCKLMDSFFMIRITGIPAPRKGLSYDRYAILVVVLILFLTVIYLYFSYFYMWKLDVANLPREDVEDESESETASNSSMEDKAIGVIERCSIIIIKIKYK